MSGVGEAAAAIAIVNLGLQVSKHALHYGTEVYGASDEAAKIQEQVRIICLYFAALNELRANQTSGSSSKVHTFILMFFKQCDMHLKALWRTLLTACHMPMDTAIDGVLRISCYRKLLWPCNKKRLHESLNCLKELKEDAFKILLLLGLLQRPRSGFVARLTAGIERSTEKIAQLWSEVKIKYSPGAESGKVQSLEDLQSWVPGAGPRNLPEVMALALGGPRFLLRATSEDMEARYIRETAERDFQELLSWEEANPPRLSQSQIDQALNEIQHADGVEDVADGDHL
ncbi:hypothetical protein N7539_008511 [Penicillium diatomitis]|uniref:Uncharacterized protein n=1 Tax=Penicillium diatomitis TaxID=2819901 RepID=A0A9W9WQQ6_9EURO|nr:uncharacterized protein N7539_008511 [Penicillium diatomitis]KAJ5471942.1 hypothetical protein N7539_008511 [Penicillium diatomitis]